MSSDKERRLDNLLFNVNSSMAKTDYINLHFDSPSKNRQDKLKKPPKPPRVRKPYEPVKFLYSMVPWKERIPFDTTIKLAPILQTNPWVMQAAYETTTDEEREHIQKTRPKLVMTPAVSIDVIDDPRVRKNLTDDMYVSTIMKDLEFTAKVAFPFDSDRAPLPGKYTYAKPLALSKRKPPYVSTEWRMDSVGWDNRALRSYCDATKEFWMSPEHAPTPCSVCDQSNLALAQRKLKYTK